MFKQCCTIHKNSEELRNKLIEIGWRHEADMYFESCIHDSIICIPNTKGVGGYFISKSRRNIELMLKDSPSEVIDCGENIPLFLAVAALRDDRDCMQWFVWDEDITFDGELFHKKGEFMLHEKTDNALKSHLYHKATVEELIEHFKK